jgi:branched-chain amino acid transport system substrate-binding protein
LAAAVRLRLALVVFFALAFPLAVDAARGSDPGVTSTSILLGATVPLTGEAAAGGLTARGADGYFDYVNAHGGVLKRKITYRYLDDEYDPAKTIQATRELVERDHVFALFNSVGTAHNLAVRGYLNAAKVPQLFVASGWGGWGREGKRYPYTLGFIPTYMGEGIIYARYIAKKTPRARIAVLYQDDEYGRELVSGLKKGLGAKARQIVGRQSYDPTSTDVQSQVARLKASGANTLMIFAFGKFAIQAFVFVKKLGWAPQIFVNAVAASPSEMLIANTSGQTQGAISIAFFKDPTDPRWARDKGMRLYRTIMRSYVHGDYRNAYYLAGMAPAYAMVRTLQKAGRNLTRKSLMRAAMHLDIRNDPFVLPGIRIKTSPTDRYPIEQAQLERWRGKRWHVFGKIIKAPRG